MIIIFEGPDNVGKTTQIELLKKFIIDNFENKIFHYLHYSNLKSDKYDKNYLRMLNKKIYINMFEIAKENRDVIFIADRFHIGEYVYGTIYRNYENPQNIFDIENYFKYDAILFIFIDDVENLIQREDGKSFSIDKEIKQKEIDLFIEAYNLSKIENKILININNKSKDEVFNIIKEVLNNTVI